MSSSIFRTYVSGPSPGAYLFSSSTNTTTCCTPRSRFSRCSRSFVTTRAKIRSCASSSRPATSITYTVRSSKLPNGRSLVAPSSATSPLQRSEMFESRLRTLRMVATWCVRQLWSSFFSSARSTSLNHASRSANERDGVRPLEHRVGEPLVEDVLLDEVDQRVGLGVDVVLVEQHLGVLEHLAQPPRERRDVVEQRLVAAQRVERHAVRLVRREVLHVLERLAAARRSCSYSARSRVVDLARLVEEAEVGALHVEAHRGDAALLRRGSARRSTGAATRRRSSSSRARTRR